MINGRLFFLFGFAHLIFGVEAIEECVDPVHFVEGIIEKKGDFGHSAELLADSGGEGLAEADDFFFQFEDGRLFVFGIVNAEVYFGQCEIRGYFNAGNGHEGGRAVDIAAFLLEYNAKIPLDQFRNLFLAFALHDSIGLFEKRSGQR